MKHFLTTLMILLGLLFSHFSWEADNFAVRLIFAVVGGALLIGGLDIRYKSNLWRIYD